MTLRGRALAALRVVLEAIIAWVLLATIVAALIVAGAT